MTVLFSLLSHRDRCWWSFDKMQRWMDFDWCFLFVALRIFVPGNLSTKRSQNTSCSLISRGYKTLIENFKSLNEGDYNELTESWYLREEKLCRNMSNTQKQNVSSIKQGREKHACGKVFESALKFSLSLSLFSFRSVWVLFQSHQHNPLRSHFKMLTLD